MTRRERLEAKLAKREEWAGKAEARSEQLITEGMTAFRQMDGQPILVGHHSEKRHRGAIARADRKLERGSEQYQLAKHHEQKADGLTRQLDRSIFSDDPDAIEQLRTKVVALTRQRDEYKRLNAWWRKHKTMRGCPGLGEEEAAKLDAEIPNRYTWERQPVPKWRLSNLGAEIRRAAERITEVERRQARAAQAEQAGGLVVGGSETWAVVTFADKPARDVLDALKGAGFRWGAGSWHGPREKLPACVLALTGAPAPEPAPPIAPTGFAFADGCSSD